MGCSLVNCIYGCIVITNQQTFCDRAIVTRISFIHANAGFPGFCDL
jgi:hypothetical protein